MKKLICFLLCLGLLLSPQVAADEIGITAQSAIAVDANTGKILYEKDANKQVGLASLTKVLTAYLVYEEIAAGRLDLKTPVDISDYAYELTVDATAGGTSLEARRYTVQQLLEATLIASSNSASIALAEKVAGSEPKFVDKMKAKLAEWGIDKAQLVNATGLNNEVLGDHRYPKSDKSAENLMSAYEVALIVKHLNDDFPQIFDITSKTSSESEGLSLTNSNLMLEGMPRMRSSVDGLKTGTSSKYGDSFVATSTERGMRLITVVLGIENPDGDPYLRFTEANRILTYINQTFRPITLVKKGSDYEKKAAKVIDGSQDSVTVVAQEDLVIVERMGSQEAISIQFKTDSKGYTAPLKKGSVVGSLTYTDKDLIGQGYLENKPPQIPVVAEKDVTKAFFPKVWWNHFVNYVNEKL